jgi:uncharacterized membrane-anchored protein
MTPHTNPSTQSADAIRLDAALKSAVAQGLLPATARVPAQDERPWPVVLLTALGAWLAALPLVGVVALLFSGVLGEQIGPYLIGVATLVGAVVVLRSHGVRLFVEQLAVVGLLVGMAAFGMGLFRDMGTQFGAAVSFIVVLGLAFALYQPWLRVVLGASAALLLSLALDFAGSSRASSHFAPFGLWLAWHIALALWALAMLIQHAGATAENPARAAVVLESLGTGWLLALLYGLAMWAGMSFLVGASLGGGIVGNVAAELAGGSPNRWQSTVPQFASAALALVAAWWAVRQWPLLKQAWLAGVAVVIVALAWFMPSLGAVLVILAFCATSGRTRVASVAALAAVWIVGAFYYQLAWPLSTKAVVLVAAGAVLGGLAWIAWRTAGHKPAVGTAVNPDEKIKPAPVTQVTPRWASAGIALTALAVLAVANIGIWQKENLIAHGQPIFVELAPADPRSLMQGDFMRLNFSLPGDVSAMSDQIVSAARPHVVARRDERGVATVLRLHTGAPLAVDELLIELAPKDGRWILVSDAWFFKEGEASRWEKAKYGEFRVEPSGRALLVGLRGAKLETL